MTQSVGAARAEYTHRVIIRHRLPYTTNAYRYYTIMCRQPEIAAWCYEIERQALTYGERISLWRTTRAGVSRQLHTYEPPKPEEKSHA